MTKIKEYEIRVTAEAETDLNGIYAYLSSYSTDSAKVICQKIEAKMFSLANLPKRHRTFYKNLRRLSVGDYQIVYIVDKNTVFIKGVFHSAMDIISHLKDR